MDKQTPNTIKIKINGKDRPVHENKQSPEQLPPVSSWEEKFKAEREAAPAKQTTEEEDDFPWLLPDEQNEVFKEDPKVVIPFNNKKKRSNQSITPYHYKNTNKKNSPVIAFPLRKTAGIFLLAIGVGVIFGFIALNFLSNDEMPDAETTVQIPSTSAVLTEEGEEKSENARTGTNSASSTAPLELYTVQAGIFSTKNGAETVANTIKDKGYASVVIETNGSYTVFAGLGKVKEDTSALEGLYKTQAFNGIDFWGGKQLSFTVNTSGDAKQFSSMIQELSSIAANSANGGEINQDNLNKLITSIESLVTTSAVEKEVGEKMIQAADSVKNNNGWVAQQILLEAVSQFQIN